MNISRRLRAAISVLVLSFLILPHTALAWTDPLDHKNDVFRDPIVSADGKIITVLKKVHGDPHEHVMVYEKGSATPTWEYKPDGMVFGLGMSADSKTIVAVGAKIWVLNRTTKKAIWKKQIGTSVFDTVALAENGSQIAAGDRRGTVYLFNRTSSKPIKTWDVAPREDGIFSLDVSKDGKTIIAGTKKSVNFIKKSRGLIWKDSIGTTKVYHVRLSSDGTRALAATKNKIYY